MPTRRIAMLLVACALSAPAAAAADDPEPPTGGTAPGSTGGTAAPEPDSRLIASAHVMVGKVATFRGLLPGDAGGSVTIERLDRETETWIAIASATIGPGGAYGARWRADVAGRITTRAVVARATGAGAGVAPPAAPVETTMTVYRPAVASWYGPGFYGRTTACGLRMTRRLMGVAHRRLPCGTPVAVRYKGATITVPVVDRGPYERGRRWDLTAAAATALGFTYTDRLGAIPVE